MTFNVQDVNRTGGWHAQSLQWAWRGRYPLHHALRGLRACHPRPFGYLKFNSAAIWLSLHLLLLLNVNTCYGIVPGSSTLLRSLAKHAGNEGAEKISKELGEATFERLTVKLASEGGAEATEQVATLTAKYGPDVIRAVDNAPSATTMLKAVDELPAEQLPAAFGRLAAGSQGRELAETVGQHGVSALRSELAHPGVGGALVRKLGGEAAELAPKLTKDQAVTLASHADDIAKLPPTQRKSILAWIRNDTERVLTWMGEFMKQNPGKTLFTVATTTVILSESDRILGGYEWVVGTDGVARLVAKPGLVERLGKPTIDAANSGLTLLIRVAVGLVAAIVGTYAGIKLWWHWREKQHRFAERHP